MTKTKLTTQLEIFLYKYTNKIGVFGCFEVTIGKGGKERVDYMTYDTNGIWRCYEVKTSVADFRSKAKKSFVGHYNYFALTQDLYEKVKDEIPEGIGVFVFGRVVKKPKKMELKVDKETLMYSMMRSLFRESDKRQKELIKSWREQERKSIQWVER